MGFFHPDEPIIKTVRATKARAPVALVNTARGCDSCSLRANWNWINTPQMALSGNRINPEVLALGEAPGEEEDKDGSAFVGESGRMLRRCIPGRDIARVCFQNTVRCHPRNNATPSAQDQHACSLFLEEDLETFPSIKAILGIGSVPLSRFYPGQSITRIHGTRFVVSIAERLYWYYPVLHPAYILRTGGKRGGDSSAAYPVLQSDIKSFFNNVDKWGEPKIWSPKIEDVLLPQSAEEAKALLYKMKGPRAIDIETTGLEPYKFDMHILTAAISDGNITFAFPVEHPEANMNWGLRFLLDCVAGHPWIAHNAAFELCWFLFMAQREGLTAWEPAPFEDSMALGRLYHERESILSLEMMSRIHLGIDFKSIVRINRANMLAEQLSDVLPYNGFDALASRLLYDLLRKQVNEDNYQLFIGSVHSTARMELLGLPIDLAANTRLKAHWQAEREAAMRAASKLYEVKQFESVKQIEFNIASGDHVGTALVEFGRIDLPKTNRKGDDGQRVEGSRYSTDDQVLAPLADSNPLIRAVLDFRESSKQESTYIDSVVGLANSSIDGMLHPKYTTMLTATTRLSSNSPNIQNFPKRRHRELREQVVAPPDHVLVSFDYGQIEARAYACATKDHALCESIIKKEDIHAYWRDQILEAYPPYMERLAEKTNETEEDMILKGGRDIIKSDFVFAVFFGSTARNVAERTGLPQPVAEMMVTRFWKRFPEAARWVKAQRQQYNDTGSTQTLCGVIRHGILWGNEVINTPIQGTATGHAVLKAQNALSYLSIEMKDPYLHPRMNIHDDLTFILPDNPDLIEAYVDIIAEELVKVRFPWQIVPWMVEAKIGYNWAYLEKLGEFIGDYIR